MHRCAQAGLAVVLLDANGRFKGRLAGPTSGNVLLRRAQHQALDDPARALRVARSCVAGKLQNSRQILLRAAREAVDPADAAPLSAAATRLGQGLRRLRGCTTLDQLRGHEGDGARMYFQVFNRMLRASQTDFQFTGRVRRPPVGRTNALLSFLYAMLLNDCVAALEGVGLDPQVGYLHTLRPGRPALALDMMEELRGYVADRLTLTLINRQQLRADDFEMLPGGAARMTDAGRRKVIVAYQERKRDEVNHLYLDRKLPLALVPHIQARLLARHLRGDLDAYPPFLAR
jgi:CRISPR-associated protein Cas1